MHKIKETQLVNAFIQRFLEESAEYFVCVFSEAYCKFIAKFSAIER